MWFTLHVNNFRGAAVFWGRQYERGKLIHRRCFTFGVVFLCNRMDLDVEGVAGKCRSRILGAALKAHHRLRRIQISDLLLSLFNHCFKFVTFHS